MILPEFLSWEKIVEFIKTYESDTFSASNLNLTEEEADRIARIIIRNLLEDDVDGIKLSFALDIVRIEKE